jgi:hypothetical protein
MGVVEMQTEASELLEGGSRAVRAGDINWLARCCAFPTAACKGDVVGEGHGEVGVGKGEHWRVRGVGLEVSNGAVAPSTWGVPVVRVLWFCVTEGDSAGRERASVARYAGGTEEGGPEAGGRERDVEEGDDVEDLEHEAGEELEVTSVECLTDRASDVREDLTWVRRGVGGRSGLR